jgi:hypothetical protein
MREYLSEGIHGAVLIGALGGFAWLVHSYSVKEVNRKPTATCGGSDEERVKWTTSPQKRSVLS